MVVRRREAANQDRRLFSTDRPLGVLWRAIENLVPVGLRGDEDVRRGFGTDRRVERAEAQAQQIGQAVALAEQRRAALAAERQADAGRRFVLRDRLCAGEQPEVAPSYGRYRIEGRAAGLAALRAMAEYDPLCMGCHLPPGRPVSLVCLPDPETQQSVPLFVL